MRGFVDSFKNSSNSLYSRVGLTQEDETPSLLDVDTHDRDDSFGSFVEGPSFSERDDERRGSGRAGQEEAHVQDDDGPVGLLAAAYNDRMSLEGGRPRNNSQLSQPRVLDSPRDRQQRRSSTGGAFKSAFDMYDTFPDVNDPDKDGDDGHRISGALGSRPSSSGRSPDEGEWDPDYEIIPVYVVPLFGRDSMVVVPAPKRPPPKEHPEWVRGVVQQGQKVQQKMTDTWNSLQHSQADSVKGKIYRTGQAQLESLSPGQRLLGGIPDYAKRLRIVHAPCIEPEQVLAYMTKTIRELGHVQRYKQMGAAALLPFTFVMDTVVIPGPGILTGLTGYHLYHASKAASGSQRLKKFVDREEGTAENADMSIDDMDFHADVRLSRYYDDSLDVINDDEDDDEDSSGVIRPTTGGSGGGDPQRDADGILLEEAITQLCKELDDPLGLEEVLQQLRRRELRQLGRMP